MSNGVHDPSLSVDALGQWQPPGDRRDPIAVLQQQEAVQAGGLELNRFNEIFIAVQQDPALQQQLQQLIQKN